LISNFAQAIKLSKMKKVSLLMVLILTATMMFGQVKFGPKIGFNASKLTTSLDSVKTQFKAGFQFGAFVRIGDRIYLQPELYYTSQGGEFTHDSTGSWKQSISLASLDIPVLIGFKVINTDLVNLRITVGPVASFIVNKKITDMNSVTGPVEKTDISNTNWYIHAGAGVDVWMFTLDIRYQVGLNKIIKEVSWNGQSVNFNTSNNAWIVSLGLKI
jgi:hypothetical protein